MKIRSISAKNYRVLEDIHVEFADDYCALSGHNNAGKSCIIRLISTLFEVDDSRRWLLRDNELNYVDDYTQWNAEKKPIELEYNLEIGRENDSSLLSFVETQANKKFAIDTLSMKIRMRVDNQNDKENLISINGEEILDGKVAKEIIRRIRSANALFLHNSTQYERSFFYDDGRYRFYHNIALSQTEQREIQKIEKQRQSKVRRFAKGHRDELNEMMGQLSDRYDVEFSPMESSSGRHMPLRINLKSKNVEVPMENWGSGTQNRTQILMSLLQANAIREHENNDEKVTPIVVIEEPESFLHPSAQAEFGKVLQELSRKLGIQVIVSTHSPYMLNQSNPQSNILLRRKADRGRVKGAEIANTSGDHWMEPFAEQLGICPPEFENWRKLFAIGKSHVVLVEGELDKNYFDFLTENFTHFKSDIKIEFVSYGGKDAIKNTILLKFMLSRIDRCFITFDLDCRSELEKSLASLNFKEGVEYLPIGLNRSGRQAIEGLLPDRVLSAVNARETELILQLAGGDQNAKKSAKSLLKSKYLDEFKSQRNYSADELKEFMKVWTQIQKRFSDG